MYQVQEGEGYIRVRGIDNVKNPIFEMLGGLLFAMLLLLLMTLYLGRIQLP